MKKYKIKDIKFKDFNKIKIGIKKDENVKDNNNKDIKSKNKVINSNKEKSTEKVDISI